MRTGADVGRELGSMFAQSFPEPLRCGQCDQEIEPNGLMVILITVALNTHLTGAAAQGKDFDGTDAALCSMACLRAWAAEPPSSFSFCGG